MMDDTEKRNNGAEPAINIELLKTLGPGYQEEWNRLIEYLWEYDVNNGECRICTILRKGKIRIPDNLNGTLQDRDDFANLLYERFYQLLMSQKLFENYDPQKGSITAYLCTSEKHLLRQYNQYRRDYLREIKKSTIQNVGHTNGVDTDKKAENQPNADRFCKFYAGLNSKLKKNSDIFTDKEKEQAGIQLYTKLSRKTLITKMIAEQARDLIAGLHEISKEESDRLLREKHRLAGASIEKIFQNCETKSNKIEEYLHNIYKNRNELSKESANEKEYDEERKKKSEINRKKIVLTIGKKTNLVKKHQKQIRDHIVKILFTPLELNVIAELLKIRKNTASQQTSRYRDKICKMMSIPNKEEWEANQMTYRNINEAMHQQH